KYLQPMIDADVDNIVLGCSHYPFLIETMRKILPAHVQIIDSGEPVARRTKKVLEELQLLNDQVSTTNNRFYTNADLNILNGFLNRLGVDSFESSYLNF
ncbi:MAG: glutamate racemase, partial [Salibacteraceae bacterium]